MIARGFLLCLVVLGLTGARAPLRFQPNPSSVIAAEMAFNRLAQEEGQWTAFRETAAKEAVMFVPQRVLALDWLKGRADPPQSVKWAPSTVYVSCNGSLAASTGNWSRPDGRVGYFTTIWQRDKRGAWKWILDHGDTLAKPRDVPDFMVGKVATCKRVDRDPTAPAPNREKRDTQPAQADESLLWDAKVDIRGVRYVTVHLWNGTGYDLVIDDKVAAPETAPAS